jgi:uncharacterized glyoxalase superfamily protein PhnB
MGIVAPAERPVNFGGKQVAPTAFGTMYGIFAPNGMAPIEPINHLIKSILICSLKTKKSLFCILRKTTKKTNLMRQKINIITLGVDDFEKSLDFYENGLGWKKSSASMDDVAFFPLGGVVLSIYPRKLLAEDANLESDGKGFSGVTLSYNAKDEAEVDAVLKKVESIGATIIKPAQKVFWGGYSGYFKDPDGHQIEVAYNPFWGFDENDNLVLPE